MVTAMQTKQPTETIAKQNKKNKQENGGQKFV